MEATDVRVTSPICTPPELARLVGMPASTVYSWLKPVPGHRPALIHHVPTPVRGWPSIPLIGLAEASVLRALREQHMQMSEIAAAVTYLRDRHGPYALGSPGLVHDGVVALLRENDSVVTLTSGQGVLLDAVQTNLKPFVLAPDGFVQKFVLPNLPGVEIDPRFSSGRMRFTRTGVPLFAITGLLEADDPPEVIADEFGLRIDEVELVREHLSWLSNVA